MADDGPIAEMTVDNVTVGKSPLDNPMMMTAGRPQIRVTLAGYAPVTRVVDVAGMDSATVSVQLATVGAVPPPAPAPVLLATPAPSATEPRPSYHPTLAWVATGLFAAGAGTTG